MVNASRPSADIKETTNCVHAKNGRNGERTSRSFLFCEYKEKGETRETDRGGIRK